MIQDFAITQLPSIADSLTGWGLLVGQGGAAGFSSSLIPMLLVGGIFLFVVILPQRRQEKQRQGRIDGLKQGDEVVTRGGIIGTVHSADDPEVLTLQVSERARIRVLRNEISDLYKGSSAAPSTGTKGPAKATPAPSAESTKK